MTCTQMRRTQVAACTDVICSHVERFAGAFRERLRTRIPSLRRRQSNRTATFGTYFIRRTATLCADESDLYFRADSAAHAVSSIPLAAVESPLLCGADRTHSRRDFSTRNTSPMAAVRRESRRDTCWSKLCRAREPERSFNFSNHHCVYRSLFGDAFGGITFQLQRFHAHRPRISIYRCGCVCALVAG